MSQGRKHSVFFFLNDTIFFFSPSVFSHYVRTGTMVFFSFFLVNRPFYFISFSQNKKRLKGVYSIAIDTVHQ